MHIRESNLLKIKKVPSRDLEPQKNNISPEGTHRKLPEGYQ